MELLKVLLIDDNRDLVTLNCSMLELNGYTTVSAYTGLDGIAMAKISNPDVIICDIGLPDIDGYKVAKALRNSKDTKDCFLISMSGYTRPSDYARATEAGFDLSIGKPVDIKELLRTLEMIGKSRQTVQLK